MRTVLLVDDEPSGVIAAHAQSGVGNTELVVHTDIDAALGYLLRTDIVPPVAVVIEPEVANGGGLAWMSRVRAHPELSLLPMIVLTRDVSDTVVHESYAARANAVVRKPVSAEGLARCVARILSFWANVNHPVARRA